MKQESKHPAWFYKEQRHIFKINHMFISSELAESALQSLQKEREVVREKWAEIVLASAEQENTTIKMS